MLLYIVLMLGIVITGCISITSKDQLNSSTRQRRYALFWFFVLWLLLAFKGPMIGSDTPAYIRIYTDEALEWFNGNTSFWRAILENKSRFETGYIIFTRLISYLFNNVQWLFIIVATFIIGVCYKLVMKRSEIVWLSIFLFVSLRLYYFSMSGIRQCIAVCICIIAYQFIERRKFISFAMSVLLAMLFHNSAIIFFIAYPISFLEFNKKNCTLIIFFSIVAFLSFDTVLGGVFNLMSDDSLEYYSHYTSTERFETYKLGNILVGAIQLAFLAVSRISSYGKTSENGIEVGHKRNFHEPSMIKYMMLISVLLSLISLKATTLDRLYYYFWFFSIIYMPNTLIKIRNREQRHLIMGLVVVLTFVYNVVLLYARPEWSNITPYHFFWE